MQQAEFTALPQRAPRERRSAKRAKVDEAQGATDGAADTPAAAAAAQAAGPAAADEQQQQPPQQDQAPTEQQEGGDTAAHATPAAGRLDLPEYRSAAVRGYKFECELGSCVALGQLSYALALGAAELYSQNQRGWKYLLVMLWQPLD